MADLSARQHAASATIKPSKQYPEGRFPLPDKLHARLALQMLPRAKNLAPAQASAIRARADAKLRGTAAKNVIAK